MLSVQNFEIDNFPKVGIMFIFRYSIILSLLLFSMHGQAAVPSFLDYFQKNSQDKISDSDLFIIVKNINKTLPKIIDSKTVLKNFFVSPAGDLLVYEFEIAGLKSDYTSKFINDFNAEVMMRACSDASVMNMVSIRSGVVYQYKDKVGEYVTAFKITDDACVKINSPRHLDYIGTSGGTALYIYVNSQTRVSDLIATSSLHQGKPHYDRGTKISSMKFDLEINCSRNLYKINRVSSFSKNFGVDLVSYVDKNDGWKNIGNITLFSMTKNHLCK